MKLKGNGNCTQPSVSFCTPRKFDTEIPNANPFTWKEKADFEQEMLRCFPGYYPFMICELGTGMREGDLIALKPGDIDFKGGFIKDSRNSVRGVISTPKTGRTRWVGISA